MMTRGKTLPPRRCPWHRAATVEDYEVLRTYACGCTLDLSNGVLVHDDKAEEIELTWFIPRKRVVAKEE